MKTTILTIGLLLAAVAPAYTQKSFDREAAKAAREEMREAKSQAAAAASPADFSDPDSFGKNVKFLGSAYAGTLYIYKSCDPQILHDELGVDLAPDDMCAVHSTATPMQTTDVLDSVWQITIPGRTVDNVIYPMLNHGGGYNIFDTSSGLSQIVYVPRVTIVSNALNDPAAVYPDGTPMNGSFTTSLAGSQVRVFDYTAGQFMSDATSRASVSGRGFSRSYFASLGLPPNVINQLFRQPMTLKFGIRARISGPLQDAAFFYTVRLLGN
jgi:hypothetical protein